MTLALALTLITSNITSAASFRDVTDGSPRDKAIQYLVNASVISGYGDGTFKPTKLISRAEIIKMLVASQPGVSIDELNANLYENYLSKNYKYAQFKDVPTSQWYAKYIVYAYDHDWIQGYPDKTFKPNQNVNMAEALKMILKFNDVQPDMDTTRYLIQKYPNWYNQFLFTAIEKKIFATPELNDIGVTFMDRVNQIMYPWTTLTRENVAEILYRVLSMKQNYAACYEPEDYVWQTYNDTNLGFSIRAPFATYEISHGEKFEWNYNTPVHITSRREVKFQIKSQSGALVTPSFTVMAYTVRDENLPLQDFANAIEMNDENMELRKRHYDYYDASDWHSSGSVPWGNITSVNYSSQLLNDDRMLTSHGRIIKNGNTFIHIFSLDWHAPCDFEKVLNSFSFNSSGSIY